MANFFQNPRIKQLVDPRNIGLYVFSLIVLAIAWSTVNAIQNNYQLQKKISSLKQQNDVLRLQNGNTYLQNKYLNSDQYLELSARKNLGLSAPGEKVMLVPQDVAMRYIDKSLAQKTDETSNAKDNRSTQVRNLEDWRDFLLGRQVSQD
jgi:cell division protein FtsB